MDTADTNQSHTTFATGFEFLRGILAGALLAIVIAVGFAAASHADYSAPAPHPEVATTTVPGPGAAVIGPDCKHPYFFNSRVYCG